MYIPYTCITNRIQMQDQSVMWDVYRTSICLEIQQSYNNYISVLYYNIIILSTYQYGIFLTTKAYHMTKLFELSHLIYAI